MVYAGALIAFLIFVTAAVAYIDDSAVARLESESLKEALAYKDKQATVAAAIIEDAHSASDPRVAELEQSLVAAQLALIAAETKPEGLEQCPADCLR